MITPYIKQLEIKKNLSTKQAFESLQLILQANTTLQENIDFIKFLTSKGETLLELVGFLDAMDSFALHVDVDVDNHIDMCGTGGDNLNTFNISTAASFVVAAAGGIVAKHGNYSSMGNSGSADIFEWLEYDLYSNPSYVVDFIKQIGLGFMFAPTFHPALKHIALARKQIPYRTVFNILGPLCNPARVLNQVIGVSSPDNLHKLANLAVKRGAKRVLTLTSQNGMDELSTCSNGTIVYLNNSESHTIELTPAKLGLDVCTIEQLRVSSKQESILRTINGICGRESVGVIDTISINAAAGLVVAGVTKDIFKGLDIAKNTIMNGKSQEFLQNFINKTGCKHKL